MEYVWIVPAVLVAVAVALVIGIQLVKLVFLLPQPSKPPPPADDAGQTPPTTAGLGFDWTLGFPSSRFWKVVWTIGVLAIASAVAWYAYTHLRVPTLTAPTMPTISLPSWNMPDIDPVSVLLLAAVVIALAVTFYVGDRKKLLTYAFVTVLLLFVLAQYKTGGIYIGHRRDILYLLGVAAIILVATYATKGKERTTFGILVAAVFVLLGSSHLADWDGFKTKIASIGWSDGGQQVASRAPDRNPCDRVVRHIRVGSDGNIVNPGGACSYSFEVTSGKLFFHGPEGSSEVWWPGKPAVGNVRKRIITAYAVTPDAELDYLLCPAGMDGTGWYCH